MPKYDYQKEKNMKQIEKTAEVLATLPPFTQDFFVSYCRVVRGMSERTITEYAKDIRIFFQYLLDQNPVLEHRMKNVTLEIIDRQSPKDLQEFITYISAYKDSDGNTRVNGASGLNRKVAALRTFYKYYYTNGDIHNNPASILAAPHIKKKEIVHLEREESDELLTTVENPEKLTNNPKYAWAERTKYRDKAIITLLLGTGLRISECVSLNLKDISWKNRAMRVIRKGGNEQTIYFNKDVEDAITDYIKYERKSPEEDVDALFVSRKKQRMSVSAMERMVKKYASVAVPQKKITPHRLRATFATELNKANNGNLMQVSVALGHSSIETAKRYVAISDQERQLVSALTSWTHIFSPETEEVEPEQMALEDCIKNDN